MLKVERRTEGDLNFTSTTFVSIPHCNVHKTAAGWRRIVETAMLSSKDAT